MNIKECALADLSEWRILQPIFDTNWKARQQLSMEKRIKNVVENSILSYHKFVIYGKYIIEVFFNDSIFYKNVNSFFLVPILQIREYTGCSK